MLRRAGKPVPNAWLQATSDSPAWLLSAHEAAREDSNAQYELGLEYLRGSRIPENIRLAAHWLRQAADANHAKAAYLMACLTREGEGTTPSVKSFLQYLRQAALQGLAAAQAEMGKLYCRGILLQRDWVRARELFLAAASSGDVVAMKELAQLPLCVSSDQRMLKSQHWWSRAAACGDPEAFFQVAKHSSDGDQRLKALLQASKLGYPEACYQLGEIYRDSFSRSRLGPRRDCEKATEFLSKACELWRAQASKLQEELASRANKWTSALNEFEEVLVEQLFQQRLLKAWHSVVSCRRQKLQDCINRCCERWQRSAWTRFVWSCRGNDMCQNSNIVSPVLRTILQQRVFTSWRLLKQDCNVSLVKRILKRWFSTSAGLSRACACRKLCRILQECLRKRYRHCLQHWCHRTRRIDATIRLARRLRKYLHNRCYAPALDSWLCWMAATDDNEYASEEEIVQAQLAALREISEDLLVQHGLELDTWRRRCAEEAGLISSPASQQQSPSKDCRSIELTSECSPSFGEASDKITPHRRYFRDGGCGVSLFAPRDVNEVENPDSRRPFDNFSEAISKVEHLITPSRWTLDDRDVSLPEPTWPGRFEERDRGQMSNAAFEDHQGIAPSPGWRAPSRTHHMKDQGHGLGLKMRRAAFDVSNRWAYLDDQTSSTVSPASRSYWNSQSNSLLGNSSCTTYPESSFKSGIGAQMRYTYGSSDRLPHSADRAVGAGSDVKMLDAACSRQSFDGRHSITRRPSLPVSLSSHHRHVGKSGHSGVDGEKRRMSSSSACSESMSPVLHEATTVVDEHGTPYKSPASWRQWSEFKKSASTRSDSHSTPEENGDVSSKSSSPASIESSSSKSGHRHSDIADIFRRSQSCGQADHVSSDRDSNCSSECQHLHDRIKTHQRFQQALSCWPHERSCYNYADDSFKVLDIGSTDGRIGTSTGLPLRQPSSKHRSLKAPAVGSVATPSRVGTQLAMKEI